MRALMLAALCVAALYGCGDSNAKKSNEAVVDAVDTIDAAIAQSLSSGKVSKANAAWKTALPKFPSASFTPGKTYYWDVETSVGSFRAKLFTETAPKHVLNTIYLTRLGFYDGLTFHRVMQQFMAQGGDPLGNGTGSPGYNFDGEISAANKHDRPYLLSTANAGPGTDSSQFFITFVPTPYLDKKHTVFGEVIEGTATLKAMEALGVPQGRDGPPTQRIEIIKATIHVE